MRKLKRIAIGIISLLLAVSLVFSLLVTIIPQSTPVEAHIFNQIPFEVNLSIPIDCVYVNHHYADSNMKGAQYCGINEEPSGQEENWRTFVKWDFSLLPYNVAGWDIINVTIGFFRWDVDVDCDGAMTGIRACYDNSWMDTTITWNNQPAFSGGEISVGGGGVGANIWELWSNNTLTEYVNNTYQNGSSAVSFVMHEDRLRYPIVYDDFRYWNDEDYFEDKPFMTVWIQESYIAFTSNPITSAEINLQYFYNVTGKFWGADMNLTSTAPWLLQEFDSYNLTGVPQSDHIGIYLVNLTLYHNGTTVYQNFTIGVMQIGLSPNLIFSLILGFGLLGFGVIRSELFILSGIVWSYSAIAFFLDYGEFFMIIGVGFGLILMMVGGVKFAEKAGI